MPAYTLAWYFYFSQNHLCAEGKGKDMKKLLWNLHMSFVKSETASCILWLTYLLVQVKFHFSFYDLDWSDEMKQGHPPISHCFENCQWFSCIKLWPQLPNLGTWTSETTPLQESWIKQVCRFHGVDPCSLGGTSHSITFTVNLTDRSCMPWCHKSKFVHELCNREQL